MTKRRLTVTVDEDVLAAVEAAVAEGTAESASGWVNSALRDRVLHEQRLRALDEAIADYEAEFGEITDSEMKAAQREARERALIVRGRHGISRHGRRSA